MWKRFWEKGEKMLPRKQSDKRGHNPQLDSDIAKDLEGILPSFLSCKGGGRRFYFQTCKIRLM